MQWHTSNGTLQRRRVLGEPTSWVGAVGLAVAVAVAYALAARLGLALLTAPDGVAVFWPAAGISAGILIALGPKARLPVAAGVMVATIAANLLGDRNLASTAIFAVCNAAEAVLIAELTRRFFGSDFRLESLRSVAGLLVATAIATSLSGIGGTAGFLLFHSSGASPLTIWQHWVASDALGVVIVAPLVVGLVQAVNDPPSRHEAMEGGATLVVLTLASILGLSSAGDYGLTILFFALLLPILLWPAAHCRPECAAAAVFILGLVVILSMTFNVGHLERSGRAVWQPRACGAGGPARDIGMHACHRRAVRRASSEGSRAEGRQRSAAVGARQRRTGRLERRSRDRPVRERCARQKEFMDTTSGRCRKPSRRPEAS